MSNQALNHGETINNPWYATGLQRSLDLIFSTKPDLYAVLVLMSRSGIPLKEGDLKTWELGFLRSKGLVVPSDEGGFRLTDGALEGIARRLFETRGYYEHHIKSLDIHFFIALLDFIRTGKPVDEETIEDLIKMKLLYRDPTGEVRAHKLAREIALEIVGPKQTTTQEA